MSRRRPHTDLGTDSGFFTYRVFARRVNTFVASFSPFLYNINIAFNDFTYLKFCEGQMMTEGIKAV